MGNLRAFLSGTRIMDQVVSPINGKITVERSLAFGTYIHVANLTQSGGIIYDIWKKPLKKVAGSKQQVARVLILGLGGGTVVKLIRKLWPEAKITGVDIDHIMVELGKKYLKLDEKEIEIVVGDAYEFVAKKLKNKKTEKYDLILVDLYVGDNFPEKFELQEFLASTRTILAEYGVVVFNRLYYGQKRTQAVKFGKTLEKIFKSVEVVYPEANIMFLCQN